MKNKTWLIFFVLSTSLMAQDKRIDSLKVASETGSLPDRVRSSTELALTYRSAGEYQLFEETIRNAIRLGYESRDKKPLIHALVLRGWTFSYRPKVFYDSTTYYLYKARQLADSISYSYGLAEVYFELGYYYCYSASGFEDSVNYYFTKATEYYDPNKEEEVDKIMSSYTNMAFYYNRIGQVERALSFVDSAETFKEDSHTMNVRAVIYDNTGQYARAIDTYLKSLALALSLKDTATANGLYNNIAAAYGNQGNTVKAKEYFMKSWKLTQLMFESMTGFDIVQILRNLGMVYDELGMIDSAKHFFKKSINEAELRGLNDPTFAAYFGMGELYYKQGNLDSSEWYLQKALYYSEESNELRIRASAKRTLGDIAFDRGDYNLSLSEYEEALDYAQKIDYVKTIKDAYEGLFKVHKQLKNYQSALEAHVQFKTFADSIFNKSTTEQIAQVEAKFLYDQEKEKLIANQEKETVVLESELKRQQSFQIIFLAISASFILLFILAVNSYRRKNRDNKIINEKSTALEKSNKELKDLYQFKQGMTNMIVHDIKTPLTTILNLSNTIDHTKAKTIAKAGDSILRLITNLLDVEKYEHTQPDLTLKRVSLSDLIYEAKLAIDLLLHDKSIRLTVDSKQDVYLMVDQDMIVRVLVNLLSNAIKFSPSNSEIVLKTNTTTDQEDHYVEISIIDHGPGIAKEDIPLIFEKFYQAKARKLRLTQSTGLGLTFCKMAVTAHNGSISVESEENRGATFTILLKVEELGERNQGSEYLMESLQLSEKDLTILRGYSPHLKALKVFNVGSMMSLLDEIDSVGLDSEWTHYMRSAIKYSNEEQYDALIKIIDNIDQ